MHYHLLRGTGLDWHLNNSCWIQKIHNFTTNNINAWFLARNALSDQGKLDLIVLLIAYRVVYLGCQLDSKLGGEVLTSKILRIINSKLKFL